MRINYPVAYAVMPIVEQLGWTTGLNELERDYGIVCYIVSKCYVVNDVKKYKSNGSIDNYYEVVFPYEKGEFSTWKRTEPQYSLNDECYNSTAVKCIYDSYELALEEASAMNEDIINKKLAFIPCTDDLLTEFATEKAKFNDLLADYKDLEKELLDHMDDLIIQKNKKLRSVLTCVDGDVAEKRFNLYESLYFFNNIKYKV